MDERTLRVLEFDKVIARLSSLASSGPGKELARKVTPETDRSRISRLLKETSDGVELVIRKGSPPLGGIHDIRDSLKRVGLGAVLSPAELLKVADTLRAARNLKGYLNDDTAVSSENTVASLAGMLMPNRRVEERIAVSIVSEEEISDDASAALGNIRRQIRSLQDSIKDRLNSIIRSSKYQKFMQESIVTMRGDRYVVPVKQEYRSEVPGLVHDSSSSGATIFIEPMAVVEANNEIKQLKIKEQVEIERILRELTNEVEGIAAGLESNISILASLDVIFAKARLSLDYNCVCPVLDDGGKIFIKKGRHPLLDPRTVVPIDFWAGDDFDTLVITGPNTGGKTVSLKTVGLFALMTQAGLHIPSGDGTRMGVFEKVFTDIGDEQSIEQSLSTFSSHMRNIVAILKDADDRSLVLFDELGAGTDPTEGAALAMAVLECLHRRGAVTVATTHYSELKLYAISTDGVENASCEFDVETLKPTYRLLIGVPGKSNAFAISKRLGLPDDILERAKEFLRQEDIRFEDILLSIEKNRSEAENERIRAERYRMEAESLKTELEVQKKRIAEQKDKIIREAREQARSILLEAKGDAEALISEIRKAESEKEASDRNKAMEEIRASIKNKVNRLEESISDSLMPRCGYAEPPRDLKPGDSVLILNLNRNGTVVVPPDNDGEAVVQAGIMKINVHVTNLRLVEERRETAARSGAGRIGVIKAAGISAEIDLRGLNLEEAVELVDKYLDDASIAGLHEVTIIHGKGTGVLRSGIQRFLKTNPHVKAFRLGKYGEGESGVTLVQLK